jgi:hypothetical protein
MPILYNSAEIANVQPLRSHSKAIKHFVSWIARAHEAINGV